MSDIKTIYHGSIEIVQKPKYRAGKTDNDYGMGFYCTEDNRAGSLWSVNKGKDGYNNKYEINIDGLKILNLDQDSILLWMAILLNNRIPDNLNNFKNSIRLDFIEKYLNIDVTDYDVVIGYRADDSYFRIADGFLGNQITYEVLKEALHLGTLGKQFVLISEKAFQKIKYINSEICLTSDHYEEYKNNDIRARNYFEDLSRRSFYSKGKTIRDFL